MANYKVFRISDRTGGSQDKLDWFKSTEYKGNDIEEIIDPSESSSKNQITSIPTPFARIDLVKTAFHEVSRLAQENSDELKLDGNTIYHKIVSDALDIGEIFFNKDICENIEIITWNKKEDLDRLLLSPNHKLLGETIKMFLKQDEDAYNFDLLDKLYLISYNYQIIGGTSPATLFFSSANKFDVDIKFGDNKMLDNKYCPLYKRDPDYQKYLYSLFKVYTVLNKRRMSEVYDYLDKNLQYLKTYNPNLYQEINHIKNNLSETDFQKIYKTLNVSQATGNSIEVLGCDLRQKKQSEGINSDFKIASKKSNKDQGKLPLVLQNNFTRKNYKYDLDDWVQNTKVPYVDQLSLDKRKLPGQNKIYPYLTVSDFLEDAIIKLVYPLNDDKFFDGNITFETDDKTGYLLPIKKAFFDYFDVNFLTHSYSDSNKVYEMRHTVGEGVIVKLRIPIEKKENGQNEYIEFERIYYPSANPNQIVNAEINKIQNKGRILELQFGVNVFPPVKQPENPHYRVMLVDRDIKPSTQHNKYELNFYNNAGQSALPTDPLERQAKVKYRSKKETEKVETQFYVINKEFDYIEVKNSFTSAIIIPNFPSVNGNDQFTFAVDFGTTNTHIEYNINGNKKTHAFEIEKKDMQVATLHKYGTEEFKGANAISTYVYQEFIPELINKDADYQFPTRTAIGFTKGTDFDKNLYALVDFNMSFFYQKGIIPHNIDIRTDLKWSNYASGDSTATEKDKAILTAYFENILLLMRSKVLLNGGDLNETSLIWFYPSSMLSARKKKLEQLWEDLYKEYITDKNEPFYISESTAPFYYFQKVKGVSASDQSVVTIDIGGGTCDISIFTQNTKPYLITSFKFGANIIFGDGYNNSTANNGFVNHFKKIIDNKLSEHSILRTIFDDMLQNRQSEDIITFFFSLESNKDIIKSNSRISFNEMLQDDNKFKIIFITYYISIIYHLAKLMKAKGLETPKYITFSGTGSKVINILGGSNGLKELTKIIFGKIYDSKNIKKMNLMQDDKPKEITAKGGVLQNQSEDDIDTVKNILLGDTGNQLVSSKNKLTYEDIQGKESLFDEVIQEVKNFIEILFDTNKDFNFIKEFGMDTSANLEDYKKILLEDDLKQFLKDGYNKKIEELGENKTSEIEETLFFYPLVGALNNLASKI